MIIAVAEKDLASAAAKRFLGAGVPVYEDATKIVDLGDSVDIIFDLTGNSDLRQILRERLHDSDNRQTVIAPAIMVRLLGHSSGTWHYPAQFLTVIPTEKGTANSEMEYRELTWAIYPNTHGRRWPRRE